MITPRSKFCAQCGKPSVGRADDTPLCLPCIELRLHDTTNPTKLTTLVGELLTLEMCPVCKTKKQQVAQSDYVGCPACYSAFEALILQKLHHGGGKTVD